MLRFCGSACRHRALDDASTFDQTNSFRPPRIIERDVNSRKTEPVLVVNLRVRTALPQAPQPTDPAPARSLPLANPHHHPRGARQPVQAALSHVESATCLRHSDDISLDPYLALGERVVHDDAAAVPEADVVVRAVPEGTGGPCAHAGAPLPVVRVLQGTALAEDLLAADGIAAKAGDGGVVVPPQDLLAFAEEGGGSGAREDCEEENRSGGDHGAGWDRTEAQLEAEGRARAARVRHP